MTNGRTIRIFLSGTFRDFSEERELLVKRVFPALRLRLKDRFVELVDVDLRWGITTEAAERGEVLPICLAEIDRARPYFIGMLGERYGWIPPAGGYAPDLLERQPWLKKHQGGKSVTELEILHGVLNNRRMNGRASFYFRAPGYARAKGGGYVASAQDRQRQLDLKGRIKASGYPVKAYCDPQALAQRIERDLWKLLDQEFPAHSVPDAFERERLKHEGYAAHKRRLYLGGEPYKAALDQALDQGAQCIVIEGASGGGKSALLANALQAYLKTHPKDIVHEHYLGASTDAGDPHGLVRRLVEAIRRTTGSCLEIEADSQKLMDSLPLWLDVASAWAGKKKARFIFALDSLNSLTDLKDLRWWPEVLPAHIHLIVSCLPGPTLITLKGKLAGKLWTCIEVKPLTKLESKTLLVTYLAHYKKTLPDDLLKQALAHPLIDNPLFIRTLAEELRLFGVHEQLQGRLSHYLTSVTIDDLFEKVLQRVEGDCGKKSVKTTMMAIWASRAGLTEKEILGIADLKPATWAPIRNALDGALLEINGRIIFAHDYMRSAVRDRYLATEASQRRSHRTLAEWFHNFPGIARRAEEEPWQWRQVGDWSAIKRLQRCIAEWEMFTVLWRNRTDDLFSYLKMFQNDDLIRTYEFVYPIWMKTAPAKRRPELTGDLADALWDAGLYCQLGAKLQVAAARRTSRLGGTTSIKTANRYVQCAHYLRQLANPLALKYAKKAVDILDERDDLASLLEAWISLALNLNSSGDGWLGAELAERALARLNELPVDARRLDIEHSIVLGWFFASSLERSDAHAHPTLSKLVEREERVFGREHRRTLESVDCLVGCLLGQGRNVEASNLAMSLYLRCYRVFGETHPSTAFAAGKFGKANLELGELVDAEWGLSKAHEILAAAFPSGHQRAALFLNELACTYDRIGNVDEAKRIRAEQKSALVGRFFYDPESP